MSTCAKIEMSINLLCVFFPASNVYSYTHNGNLSPVLRVQQCMWPPSHFPLHFYIYCYSELLRTLCYIIITTFNMLVFSHSVVYEPPLVKCDTGQIFCLVLFSFEPCVYLMVHVSCVAMDFVLGMDCYLKSSCWPKEWLTNKCIHAYIFCLKFMVGLQPSGA